MDTNARFFLNSKNIDSDTIEKICSVINSVSFSNNKRIKPAGLVTFHQFSVVSLP